MEKFISSKMGKIGDRWERVSLTKEEIDKAMKELLEFNIAEIKRVAAMTKESTILVISQQDAVKLLFERQGVSSYTFLSNVLDDKIQRLKDGSYRKTIEPKKGEMIEVPEDMEEKIADEDNPFEAGKLKNEYEEIKLPKEKKGRFL